MARKQSSGKGSAAQNNSDSLLAASTSTESDHHRRRSAQVARLSEAGSSLTCAIRALCGPLFLRIVLIIALHLPHHILSPVGVLLLFVADFTVNLATYDAFARDLHDPNEWHSADEQWLLRLIRWGGWPTAQRLQRITGHRSLTPRFSDEYGRTCAIWGCSDMALLAALVVRMLYGMLDGLPSEWEEMIISIGERLAHKNMASAKWVADLIEWMVPMPVLLPPTPQSWWAAAYEWVAHHEL